MHYLKSQERKVFFQQVQWLHFTDEMNEFVTADVKFFLHHVYQKLLKTIHF